MPDAAADRLRRDLLASDDSSLRHRRAIAGLSIFSATVLGGIALFQLGIVKKLPDPPGPIFDANLVNGSPEAYSHLATPDALLGMASSAVTACLAAAGPRDRCETAPWLPLALAAKSAVDATVAASLSAKQWTKFRKFSIWSLLAAGASIATLPLAIPEARRALDMF